MRRWDRTFWNRGSFLAITNAKVTWYDIDNMQNYHETQFPQSVKAPLVGLLLGEADAVPQT